MKNEVKNEVNVEVAELLKPILADQYVLYTKTRNYHWNVKGNMFYMLHEKFEDFYNTLAEDIDEVAESIRTLGVYAPGTMSEFIQLAGLKEEKEGHYPDQITMAQNIVNDYDFLIIAMKNAVEKIQGEYNDEVTAGLLLGFIEKYEKDVWMLKATLANN
jgi:starvation-inducible DNA-binding protein